MNTYNIDPPKRHNDGLYTSVKFARSIRHDIKKQFKPIYDIEADPEKWDWPIEQKAKELGIAVEDYQYALEYLKNHHRFRLGITLFRLENDFLENWWRNIKLAERWAKEKRDAKVLLSVEAEKQKTIKRLIETGRLKYPNEPNNKREVNEPIIIKPLNSEKGTVLTSIDKEDGYDAS